MDANGIQRIQSLKDLNQVVAVRRAQVAGGSDAFTAIDGMLQFKAAQLSGNKVFREPMHSRIDLVGYANPVTGIVSPREFLFFSTAIGGQGQGFNRALTEADTTLEGTGGQMVGGNSFVADRIGLVVNVLLPFAVKHQVVEHSYIRHLRMSHRWKMGKAGLFPAREFGLNATATTAAGRDYATNGSMTSKQLPAQGRLFFPAKQQIQFSLTTTQDMFLTSTGIAAVTVDEILARDYSSFIELVMDGWRFEHASVG